MQAAQMNGNQGFPIQPNQQYNQQTNPSFQQYPQNQMYNQHIQNPKNYPNSNNLSMNRAGQTYNVSRGRGRGRPPKNGRPISQGPGSHVQMQ